MWYTTAECLKNMIYYFLPLPLCLYFEGNVSIKKTIHLSFAEEFICLAVLRSNRELWSSSKKNWTFAVLVFCHLTNLLSHGFITQTVFLGSYFIVSLVSLKQYAPTDEAPCIFFSTSNETHAVLYLQFHSSVFVAIEMFIRKWNVSFCFFPKNPCILCLS